MATRVYTSNGGTCTPVSVTISGSTRYLVIVWAHIGASADGGAASVSYFPSATPSSDAFTLTGTVTFNSGTGGGVLQGGASNVTTVANTGPVTFTLVQESDPTGVGIVGRSITVIPLN